MKRWLLVAVLCLFIAPGLRGATCSATTFQTAQTYPAPAPSEVVVADFNNDGFPDIASSSANGIQIAVLLNNGDGTYGPPIVTPAVYSVYQLVAADLRGNGTIDLVVAIFSGVQVFLGNGDGTFAPPVWYTGHSNSPSALAVGKFDANGTLDVALADNGGSLIELFPGNGDGTLGSAVDSDASGISALATGDFNDDGKLDLVSANGSSGTISFHPGLGDGRFGPPSSSIAGGQLGGVAAGDFDGNGALDVVATTGATVSVLIGNGDGTFQAALQYPAPPAPQMPVVADFDQDGRLDVAVVDLYAQTMSVLLGNGDGTLQPPSTYVVARQTSGLAAGDLDGDGFPDVVSANDFDSVIVLLNDGSGSLRAIPVNYFSTGLAQNNTQVTLATGDWNGDGRQDLAWSSGTQIAVIQSLGAGRFEQIQTLSGFDWDPGLNGVASGDFDGDGVLDLVSPGTSNIYMFRGLGNGTFADPVSAFVSGLYSIVTVADFNGDGKSDIAFAGYAGGGPTIAVLAGNGDGTFQPPVQTNVGVNVFSMLPADLNGDGRADLVTTSESGAAVLLGNGDGTFQPPIILTNGGCCLSVYVGVAPFSGGPLDVLVAQGNASVSLFPGNGDGTFGSPIQIGLDANAGPVTTGDYDGDGHLDFAVVSGNNTVVVYPGLGNRHFQTPVSYPNFFAAALVSASFAGGGPLDIAMLAPGTVATLVNTRLGAAVRPVSVLVGSPAVLTAAASGSGPIAYQWRRNGTPLVDGGSISGATTATLTIDPATFGDAGSYDVLVTDSCTSTASNAATLAVEFADVPATNIFHADIITIATAGVTAGCGGANYCPTALVTRAQMSTFLLKSEHGSSYVPPVCSGLFGDVACPSPFADWIEQLANEGVTAGCGGGNYCPDASITRAQMAVFLLKTKLGSGYVPPPAVGIFGDVPPGSFAADWIEDLYNRGIAGGCSASPLLYCPGNPVNRGQMAALLVNTFF